MLKSRTLVTNETIAKLLKYAEPRIQRNLNIDHIKQMIEDQIKEYKSWKTFSMLQSITVASVGDEMYVLDGHHRLRAFKELCYLGYPVEEVAVPVIQYNLDCYDEMLEYYRRINKNMPLHPLEKASDFAEFDKMFIAKLTQTWSLYFKEGEKAFRCPHIGLNELKSRMLAINISAKMREIGRSWIDLWNSVESLNTHVQKLSAMQLDAVINKRIKDCIAKDKNNTCYLGIWRRYEWLNICLNQVMNGGVISDDIYVDIKRQKIPWARRIEVWKKTHKGLGDVGECFVCKGDLMFNDMECGHVKAHALGGDIDVDNLYAICKGCNRDMGMMNLFDYKSMLTKN